VDDEITTKKAEEVIRKSGGRLLLNVRLFDVYEGKPIPPGRKSLAYNVVYQSPDRTLKEEEVMEIQKRVLKSLEEELGAVIRT
jgi:phenylalanyl-tRNA synthetase beta chain